MNAHNIWYINVTLQYTISSRTYVCFHALQAIYMISTKCFHYSHRAEVSPHFTNPLFFKLQLKLCFSFHFKIVTEVPLLLADKCGQVGGDILISQYDDALSCMLDPQRWP